jgi:1,4-dihydroxy-2-naphthoate octaprenyltransferase
MVDASEAADPESAGAAGMSPTFSKGFWRLADPKITLASAASMLLGATAAACRGGLSWPWLALTVLGIFSVEVAKNASGEIFDFDSGADVLVAPEDRSPFSGGKRVLVDHLLTRRETAWVAGTSYALAIASGIWIALAREPRILAFGVVGIAVAWFYHAPPLRLSYRGLGEVAVGIAYGPLICCGTYLVQRGQVSSQVILLSLPLGLLIVGFLWVNEFPDYRADTLAGKRTLVVRLGRRRASGVLLFLVAVAFVIQVWLPAAGLPKGVWLGLLALPFAVAAARRVAAAPENTALVIPAQKWMLGSFVILSLAASGGLLVSSGKL